MRAATVESHSNPWPNFVNCLNISVAGGFAMRVALVHHQWGIVTLAALTASILGCGGGDTAAPVANNPAPQGASSVAAASGMAPMSGMNPTPAAGAHNAHGAMAQHGATPAAGIPAMPGTTSTPGATSTPMPSMAHAGGTANPNAPMPAAHGAPAGTPTATPAATPTGATSASAHAAHGAAAPAAAATPPIIPGGAHTAHAGAGATSAPVPGANPAAGNIPAQPTTPAAHIGAAGTLGDAAAANAAAGGNSIPAQPGAVPGQPGEGAQGQGANGASAITGEPGSIDYVLSKLVAMAKAGDYTGIDSIVSEKAKGLAATFREQELKPTQIEAYKVTFDGLQLLNQRAAGSTGRMYTLKKGETFVQITVAKENGSFKIKEMQIRDGKVK